MATQKALIVPRLGDRVELTASWPIPLPEANEVQVRVLIAALNPHDQRARDIPSSYAATFPAVLAHDVVGIVTLLGPNVTKYSIGDRVVAQSHVKGYRDRGLQEYAVVNMNCSMKVPEGVSDYEAATLPTNLMAAVIGLFDESALGIPAPWREEAKGFQHGDASLLILGGGSNCGRFVVELAKLVKIGKIVVVGGDEKELKGFGATHVLCRHQREADILKDIFEIVGDDLVYALDAVNPPASQHLGINALSSSKKGTLARLVFQPGSIDQSKILGNKEGGYEVRESKDLSHIKPKTAIPFWEHLGQYLREGSIRPLTYEVVEGLNADKANEVLDLYRDGKKVIQTHFRMSM